MGDIGAITWDKHGALYPPPKGPPKQSRSHIHDPYEWILEHNKKKKGVLFCKASASGKLRRRPWALSGPGLKTKQRNKTEGQIVFSKIYSNYKTFLYILKKLYFHH